MSAPLINKTSVIFKLLSLQPSIFEISVHRSLAGTHNFEQWRRRNKRRAAVRMRKSDNFASALLEFTLFCVLSCMWTVVWLEEIRPLIQTLYYVMPCRMVNTNRRFGQPYCLHLHDQAVKEITSHKTWFFISTSARQKYPGLSQQNAEEGCMTLDEGYTCIIHGYGLIWLIVRTCSGWVLFEHSRETWGWWKTGVS